MMSIALRFIPTLLDEADRIIKTQKARGVEFGSGSIYKRAINITSIIIPLFISSFKRADELAIAMEARGYRGGITRSSYNILTFTSRDVLFLILLVLLISIIVILWGRKMNIKNIKLEVSYEGTNFCGFQIQPNQKLYKGKYKEQ